MYTDFHVKYLLFLSDFNETWIFLGDLQKNTHISNFMKIHLVGAKLLHADRWMDRQNEAKSLSKTALQKHQQIASSTN